MEKKRISLPIIVEGKYDKITLASIFDCRVFVTGGFGVFNNKELQALLRKIAKDGVILLCDSDGGGAQIRSHLNGIIPKDKIFNLYIPEIKGKERRKTRPSKQGTLGVEGMSREVLERIFSLFVVGERVEKTSENSTVFRDKLPDEMITKVDMYFDGLTGDKNSAAKRDLLADKFDLPHGMSAGALLEALNIITDKSGYRTAVEELFS